MGRPRHSPSGCLRSPCHIRYAREARTYTVASFFALVALCELVRFLEKRSSWAFVTVISVLYVDAVSAQHAGGWFLVRFQDRSKKKSLFSALLPASDSFGPSIEPKNAALYRPLLPLPCRSFPLAARSQARTCFWHQTDIVSEWLQGAFLGHRLWPYGMEIAQCTEADA